MSEDLVLQSPFAPYVIKLSLNRPHVRNALSIDLIKTLLEKLHALPQDTRVMVLQGEGPLFCSGIDLHEVQNKAPLFEAVKTLFETLATLSCITVASVHGGVYAGGLGLVAACDLCIASRETLFSLPELRRGIPPTLIYQLLKRQIPPYFLRELMLIGEPITAVRAHTIGLVNQVIAFEERETFLKTYIYEILKNAPEAMKKCKQLLFGRQDLQSDLDAALKHHAGLRDSAEALEGAKAFIEKKAPNWIV